MTKVQGIPRSFDAKIMAMIRLIGLGLVVLLASGNTVGADLVPAAYPIRTSLARQFHDYQIIGDSLKPAAVLAAWLPEHDPGRTIGGLGAEHERITPRNWRYRRTTYELLFPSGSILGGAVYQLALFTGDLDASVSRERFKKGAQGFHYSMEQILAWANTHARDRFIEPRRQDDGLLTWLVLDGVIKMNGGKFFDTGRVRHVLGACASTSRSLNLNLNHERWHVFWDEDLKFRATYYSKWEALTRDEQKTVYQSLGGYSLKHETAAIEEWAVRQQETAPIW